MKSMTTKFTAEIIFYPLDSLKPNKNLPSVILRGYIIINMLHKKTNVSMSYKNYAYLYPLRDDTS